MKNYHLDNKTDIKLHNILYSITSPSDYEMERLLLLTDMPNTEYGEYVLVEGSHCSCYDFDETQWEATVYSKEELGKLLEKTSEYDTLRLKLKRYLEYYNSQFI